MAGLKRGASTQRSDKPSKRSGAAGKRGGPTTLLDAAEALLQAVLRFEAPADAVLGEFFCDDRRWGSRDRTLLGDVVYAVLRRLRTLREALPPAPMSRARGLALLVWPAQYLDQVAIDEPARVALDAARRALAAGPPAPHRELPDWLAAALKHEVGDAFDALAASLLEPAPLDLRVNTLKARRDDVIQALAQAGIACRPTPMSPWGLRVQGKPSLAALDITQQGLVEVQDEGSQLLALLVDAKRGEMVADVCAGGGGKTLALGAAMKNTGRLYAMDVSASRLAALAPRLARSGLSNVYTLALDGDRDPSFERLVGKLDRVLVDAPCTGLGTLRRHPQLKWRVREGDVAAMAQRQLELLHSAARLVKPGGRLVYATCSLLGAENEAVARAFLAADAAFVAEDSVSLLRGIDAAPEGLVNAGEVRLWPHVHATDGFFAAVMRRR